MSEASREENGERGGEKNACQQTGTNRGYFSNARPLEAANFHWLKVLSLNSLFEVNKLCKIIPSVASCQDCVKKPEAKQSDCSGDEFYRYYILDGCLD